MKKIILSRKGFDSVAGGKASPIFPDGKMFPLPIPTKYSSPYEYKDITKNGIGVSEAFMQAGVKKIPINSKCHYDPILEPNTGLFGQVGKVQKELQNHQVNVGDLFLFFGWFRDFSSSNKRDIHHIFGWLEIDIIIKGTENIKEFCQKKGVKHPHADNNYELNTLYVGRNALSLGSREKPVPGYGEFKKTSNTLVLTENGQSRSNWLMPKKFFSEENNPKLFSNRLKWNGHNDNRVQCKGYGQEFIINVEENPSAIDWAKSIIIDNYG